MQYGRDYEDWFKTNISSNGVTLFTPGLLAKNFNDDVRFIAVETR